MNFRASLPTLILSLAALPAAAQQFAHLSGVILDSSGGSVSQAAVTVVNEETGFRRVAESRSDGSYIVASLQPGTYKVTVRKEGFRSVLRFGVKLDVAETVRVDFTLPVGSMQESITVEGSAPLLNTEDAAVGTLVSRDRIDHLPLNGRGILSLLELAPGTVVTPATRGESGQFTANGQRPNAHYFTVDGVSVNTGVSGGAVPAQATGGSLPGLTAFGSLHSVAPLESLEEFRIQTSSVVPEFGRLPGAQVALSTRSGSNDLHGSAFYYFRHEKLGANDWYANRQRFARAPLRNNDVGASLGGPLLRDHTFFFLSYEGMRLRQPMTWRAAVPSLAFRQDAPAWSRPLLDLFPAANGPSLGKDLEEWTASSSRPSTLDTGSVRVDHSLTSRITLFGRYSDTPSATRYGTPQVNELTLRSRSVTAGSDIRLTPAIVLSFRWSAAGARADSVWRSPSGALAGCALDAVTQALRSLPATCDTLVRFSITGVGQLVSGREGTRRQSQSYAAGTAHLVLGSHQVRLGFDRRRIEPIYHSPSGSLSVIAESVDDILQSGSLWIATAQPRDSSALLTEFSAFAQDSWRIGPRLSAAYGVRWDYNPSPVADQAYYADPEQGVVLFNRRKVWNAGSGSFAPRAGFTWRPHIEGNTVFRFGGGLFYDSSLSIATDVVNGGPLSMNNFLSGRSAPFASVLSYGFASGFRMPYVVHWNVSVEHALSPNDVLSAAYVGSGGRDLLRRELTGETGLLWVELATNHGQSRYQGLQLQYRRRMASRVQALVSYAWSHSIDNGSSDSALQWTGPSPAANSDRGSSDFDVRHALAAALTYEHKGGRLLGGWALDGIFRARTGFPINVLNAEQAMGLSFGNAFRPDLVPGAPLWVADPQAPTGRVLNRAAFHSAGTLVQGTLGRNVIPGFGMSQTDLALRRDFKLRDHSILQFRLEAFNLFNQANFADPVPFLSSPLFGQSPSMLNLMLGTGSPGSGLAPMFQTGGPRIVEAVIRVRF